MCLNQDVGEINGETPVSKAEWVSAMLTDGEVPLKELAAELNGIGSAAGVEELRAAVGKVKQGKVPAQDLEVAPEDNPFEKELATKTGIDGLLFHLNVRKMSYDDSAAELPNAKLSALEEKVLGEMGDGLVDAVKEHAQNPPTLSAAIIDQCTSSGEKFVDTTWNPTESDEAEAFVMYVDKEKPGWDCTATKPKSWKRIKEVMENGEVVVGDCAANDIESWRDPTGRAAVETAFCWGPSAPSPPTGSASFGKPLDTKLSAFEKALVVKSLRENFLNMVARNVVLEELGQLFIEPGILDSVATMPLIFVLSAGADPTEYLLTLAAEKGYTEKLHFISLGQGQGPKAEALIKLGWDTGDWAIQESQDPEKINEDYRLWLTSMPSPKFPVPDVFEGCPSKPFEFKKLLFGLAFFHAVILERRKFGPIGWNIPYEWMDSDFQVSREQVRMYLVSQPDVPWITLRYIIAEVNYGGRVTDDKDMVTPVVPKDVRLISAVLKGYFSEGILEKGFKFAGLDAYWVPDEGCLQETRDYLKSLPMDEESRFEA
eukprot:g27099.t1